MKRIFTFAALLLLSHTGFCALEVTWIDDDTVQVSGYGYGNITNDTALGSCTNCLAISPDEMRSIKSSVLSSVGYALQAQAAIDDFSSNIYHRASSMFDDIGTFRRIRSGNSYANATSSEQIALSNYIYSVNNYQTRLDKANFPPSYSTGYSSKLLFYNDGIYDYAQSVSSYLTDDMEYANRIRSANWSVGQHLNSIKSTVEDITEESCRCSGDGSGSGTNGNNSCSAPCKEQWETLLDYVRHIDDDQHDRLVQLNQISNYVFNIDRQLDSYAKLVSGVLYNDGTIVVDDGANSWTNVYRRGYSDLYDYDKSNILQRIELLLFGLASPSSPTNWGDIGQVDSAISYASSVDDADVQSVNDTIGDQLDGIGDHFDAMFDALNFFGSGSLNDFSLNDPTTVFGIYDFEVASNDVDGLSGFRSLCRTCFQIFYWCGGIAFLVFFWYFVISTVVRHVLFFIRFFNNLLT